MVMMRTLTSFCSIFFLFSLTAAVPEDESTVCNEADQSKCMSAPSWTQAMADEDAGLELLQIKGTEKSKKICPTPDTANFVPVAKYCPKSLPGEEHEQFDTCIDKNRGHSQFANAWEKCGLTVDCGSVLLWTDGVYYLRRPTDPDSHDVVPGVRLFFYECESSKEEERTLEKMAEDKAQEIVNEEKKKLHKKEQAEVHKINDHWEGELQQIKDRADRVETEEEQFVTQTEMKSAEMHEQAVKLRKTVKHVAKDAAKARDRLDKANKVEAEAQYLIFHDDGIKMTKEEAAQKVAQEKTDIEGTKAQFQEVSKEAAALSTRVKELQSHIDDIKKFDEKKIKKAEAQADDAKEEKANLVTELTHMQNKKQEVQEKMKELQLKLREGESELREVEAQMLKD